MATQILRPQNCIGGNRFRREKLNKTPRIRSRPDPDCDLDKTSAKPRFSQSNRRKRGHRSPSEPMVDKSPSRNLVIGQVKILKRGETLDLDLETSLKNAGNRNPRSELDLAFRSTESVTTQKKKAFAASAYAGCIFSSSPPPSSLPFPGFLSMNGKVSAQFQQPSF